MVNKSKKYVLTRPTSQLEGEGEAFNLYVSLKKFSLLNLPAYPSSLKTSQQVDS